MEEVEIEIVVEAVEVLKNVVEEEETTEEVTEEEEMIEGEMIEEVMERKEKEAEAVEEKKEVEMVIILALKGEVEEKVTDLITLVQVADAEEIKS